MAIRWSDEYPGQIAVDPGWPHGKPRNVAVPGDGSGTPLEAAWVSDLAGWQAALLQEAGITPSGDPDKVGASDYTEAIKTLAGAGLANFTSTAHTWTAPQGFTSGYIANSWGVQGEVLYCDAGGIVTAKARTTLHLMRGLGADATGKVEGGAFGSVRLTSPATLPAQVPAFTHEIDLPEGAVLTGWRMIAATEVVGGGTAVRGSVQLTRMTPDFAAVTGADVAIGPEAATTGNMTGEILAASGLSATVTATSRLRLLIKLTAAADGDWIDFGRFGLELTWLDPGPRNF